MFQNEILVPGSRDVVRWPPEIILASVLCPTALITVIVAMEDCPTSCLALVLTRLSHDGGKQFLITISCLKLVYEMGCLPFSPSTLLHLFTLSALGPSTISRPAVGLPTPTFCSRQLSPPDRSDLAMVLILMRRQKREDNDWPCSHSEYHLCFRMLGV